MAFPATYNFSYYRGDTLEFRLFPKDTSGLPFSLEDFSSTFTISTARGSDGTSDQVTAYSAIVDGASILCAIRPQDSLELTTADSYVYDVEIRNTESSPYPLIYTIMTGTITVEEQVTDIQVTLPSQPTGLTLTPTPAGVLIDWTAPAEGDAPTSYNIYGQIAPNLDTWLPITTVNAPTTEYLLTEIVTPLGPFPIVPGTYNVKVLSENAAGENQTVTAENSESITITVP